jgi:hypothetical protein
LIVVDAWPRYAAPQPARTKIRATSASSLDMVGHSAPLPVATGTDDRFVRHHESHDPVNS